MVPTTPDGSPQGESAFCARTIHEAIVVDRVLQALSDPCRREILGLLDAEPVWTVDELLDNLGPSHVYDAEPSREQTRIALRHKHLPRLAEVELVTVDDELVVVERGGDFEVVRDIVRAATEAAPRLAD